jgi:alkanesulfonate monooxygenase SsuD/methylene tetrahydromethanopterin reductase-like flavin-dependent oxidoreductase (luciferase family)
MESEYRMYGYDYPVPKIRMAQLDEAIRLIRAMWTESPASFEGEHYRLDKAYANPLPVDPPIVMVGASGEQLGLRVVAKHADWWNTTASTPEALTAKRDVLAAHCEKVGRDVDDILVNWQCQVVAIGDSEAEARRIAEAAPLYQQSSNDGVVGTPEQVSARLQEFIAAGVRDFNLRFADFPRTEGALRFAREIAPRLSAS